MNNYEFNARNKFSKRIEKGLLGPGSDTWGLPDEEEIISEYPLIRYFTGVLFPNKKEPTKQSEADDNDITNETSDEENNEPTDIIQDSDSDYEKSFNFSKIEDLKISHNNFFPNNIAISFCIDNSINQLDVEFLFGLYFQPNYKEKKIKIHEEGFDSFFYSKIPYRPSFLDKLKYRNGFMALSKDLEGNAGGRGKERSGDYKEYDKFRIKENIKESLVPHFIHLLDKLISRAWKRKQIKIQIRIPIINTDNIILVDLPSCIQKDFKVGYSTKVYYHNNQRYVKVQLVNCSSHPANRFSNKNESLNAKCMFQSKIKVISENIKPFKTLKERLPFDDEAERLNFIYRNVKNYAVGHNCSATWNDKSPRELQTTFIPKTNVEEIKNERDDIKDKRFNQALVIKNLSNFGKSQSEIIADLNYFISFYQNWINDQKTITDNLSQDKDIADYIISKQTENLNRIKQNIGLLKDSFIFQAFQLMNLAMLIQITISNDENFSKKEKELSELNSNIEYNSLEFFRKYMYKEEIRYRPFQLAFILLSLDGIVNKDSNSRKDTVDLIWFPTGGGKTEAYLAVTAFTIIWRRLKYEHNYTGTTVIMRYTLRLLTAQQFERASRLIAVLEFLRNQEEFSGILKEEPISIGQWIGMSSTPNKIEDVKEHIDKIDSECDKKNGNPQEINPFQISSCPWCGTKLISKDKISWDYGFEVNRNDFNIHCLNSNCPFHKKIPVQVVDEVLYNSPPTLLFGTVDKFAMLSWKPEAYSFFNTHDDNLLPPDLIIQDELHLLNGPLGSIAGLFENVIELLCTRNGISPKFIASTATTRNTEHQVKQLYGNRKVNIFPPQGLNHDDSFFAKSDKNNKRRMYLGFIPTGKTNIDTQIHILAHLLVARIENFSDKQFNEWLDNYWTVVSYYNSLKDVGRIHNKIGDEIFTFTANLQIRLFKDFHQFNYIGLPKRTKELTSRISSEKIKSTLNDISEKFTKIKFSEKNGYKYLNDIVDLVLATNMISVGIDVSRLNIMLINGMPRNIAEYIQASSRVGRNTYGLVVTLLNGNRAREKSFFEHFIPFHQSFYKFIEPLSVTTFTENTMDKMLSSLMISYIRQMYPGELGHDNQLQYFTKDKITPLIDFFVERYKESKIELSYFQERINYLADDLVNRINNHHLRKYKELLKNPSELDNSEKDWFTMQSMRDIDTSTFIEIKGEK